MRGFSQINKAIDIDMHQSDIILRKLISDAKIQKKYIKESLNIKLVLKTITQAYSQNKLMIKKIKINEAGQIQTLIRIGEYIFESFVQKYGLSDFSTQKFKQFLGALLKHKKDIVRVKLFSDFMGLELVKSESSGDEVDFDFYIKGYEFILSQ